MATITLAPTMTSGRVQSAVVKATRVPSAKVNAAPVRLTRRGRRLARTVMVALALVIALGTAVFGHISAGNASSASTKATSTVVVQPGQTMWGLASSIAPNDDPRDTIARIADLNGLTDAQASAVHPGQRLIVPIAG
jgi:LysM repeat protein